MTTVEQEIIDRVQRMTPEQQQELLQHIQTMPVPPKVNLVRELMNMSPEEREHRIAESFAAAEGEEFEIFEANDLDDSYDEP